MAVIGNGLGISWVSQQWRKGMNFKRSNVRDLYEKLVLFANL
jgi:hypothetical protein